MLFVIILVMIYTANCEQKAEKNTEKANNNWRNCAPFAAFPDKIPSIFRRKMTMSKTCGTTESGRTDPAVRRARRLTETAVMTALLIVLQAVTKPTGQYITGTCVNAVLAVSVLAAGLWSGIAVALLSPLFAFLLGIGPQLPPIVPSIAVGNLVFVLLLGLLAALMLAVPAKAARTVPVQIDGTALDAFCHLENGVTYVPLRALLNALGDWDVFWDSGLRAAVAVSGDSRLTADPAADTVTVDSDVRAGRVYVQEGVTYVPLRTTAELLGSAVEWDTYFQGAADGEVTAAPWK